jgi:predicted O-methyltransferase YrrM
MWLYRLCRERRPKTTLEIGLAYGFSMLYVLAAIRENGAGHHTAVDPFQKRWHGIGWRHSQSLDLSDSFRVIADKGVPALVHFAERGEMFEVIFIDGNHRFDDVLVDFTLSAEVCPMGGYIILDDMWMPSISLAAAFIRSNRKDFEELNTPVANIAVFLRIGEDARRWHHYAEFSNTYYVRRALQRLAPVRLRRGVKALARFVK